MDTPFLQAAFQVVPVVCLSSSSASSLAARPAHATRCHFFRDTFRRSRCLIPASGYYEWQDTAAGKQPWYFTRADGEPITFAGLG
jgi:putative SOS response-associated peptidase YedK